MKNLWQMCCAFLPLSIVEINDIIMAERNPLIEAHETTILQLPQVQGDMGNWIHLTCATPTLPVSFSVDSTAMRA